MGYRTLIRFFTIVLFIFNCNYDCKAFTAKDTAFVNSLIKRYKLISKKPEAKATLDSIRQCALKANYSDGVCFFYYWRSMSFISKRNFDTAQVYIDSLKITAKKDNNKFYEAQSLVQRGRIFSVNQDHDNAISLYLSALKVFDPNKPSAELASTFQYLGIEYYKIASINDNKEYSRKSFEYFEQCLSMAKKVDAKKLIANSLNNLGSLSFHLLQDYDKALDYFEKSLVIKQELKLNVEIPSTYDNIANSQCMLAKKRKDNSLYIKALENYNKAKSLSIEDGDTTELIHVYCNMSSAYNEMNQLDKTSECIKQAQDLNSKKFSLASYLTIMAVSNEFFASKKDFAKAYYGFRRMQVVKDSLQTLETVENINKMQVEYGTFKKDKEIELLTKNKQIDALELARKQADINRQRILIFSVLVILVVLIILSFFIYKSNKEKQLINIRLEEQHKDITDSINYAKLIQQAIFPEKELKQRLFPDAFVLLIPKDVVSGDFYWFGEEGNKRIIAAVDCTGHGVPGAFMSMIGNAFLNEIIHEKKITSPSLILNELRSHVIHALKQEGNALENKDGMDIAICVFDKDFKTVEFAGANNPLWLIRGEELQQINADKQPIGLSGKNLNDFTNHKLQLNKNDILYIFTDGFADQFGGPRGKKFKYKPLQQLLISNKDKPMLEVEETLIDTFNSWKGNLHQVDDVCIIGIRV